MQSRLKAGWWLAIFLGRWASHMSQKASLSCEIQEQQWQASKETSSGPPLVERRLNLPQKGTSWRNGEMMSQKNPVCEALTKRAHILTVSEVCMPELKKCLLSEQSVF